jgi:pimeloyl-ACP methyl ester carboxylesterase
VLALDLAGFGHTRSGRRSTSVQANAQLLLRFLDEVAGTPAILVGNSMGGLISILLAAQHPEAVAGLVLVDPALPIALGSWPDPRVAMAFATFLVPAVGRRVLARRRDSTSAEEAAHALLRLCCADPSRVPDDVVDLHIDLAARRRDYPDVDSELLTAAQSLMWVLADRRRLAEMQRSIDVPVLLMHGDQDRLVSIASARAAAAANPSWRFEVATGIGHVPQLEAPEWTLDAMLGWLAEHPEAAARASRAQVRLTGDGEGA